MFANLLNFWKGKDFLNQVLTDFEKMLSYAEEMFHLAYNKLMYDKDDGTTKDKVYELDRHINDLERDIRKRVVTHLSIQGEVDLPMCLIMMSVVKDAERIGDYAKNIYEVSQMLSKALDQEAFKTLFEDVETKLLEGFVGTKTSFIESNKVVAKEVIATERDLVKRCDLAISRISKSDYETNMAVCFTLLARYFKRIAAHLANISSSVILPIQDLDFFNEKYRRSEVNKNNGE